MQIDNFKLPISYEFMTCNFMNEFHDDSHYKLPSFKYLKLFFISNIPQQLGVSSTLTKLKTREVSVNGRSMLAAGPGHTWKFRVNSVGACHVLRTSRFGPRRRFAPGCL
jgi:hypothetical protein